jgi:hypothetical protein
MVIIIKKGRERLIKREKIKENINTEKEMNGDEETEEIQRNVIGNCM